MCGRFGLYHSSELLGQHVGLDFVGLLEDEGNELCRRKVVARLE
jgi:hypothetical protein